MRKNSKIVVGIRDSKLSQAQTNIFLEEANKIEELRNLFSFDVRTIKTTGDIHNSHRLDQIGGKGLFVREIEEKLISEEIDLAVHSMKDIPAQDSVNNLKIVCFLRRLCNNDVLLSNSGKKLNELPSGSIIGTSSIRRRSQILNLRKDLSIKLLRGNVDTRIKKLRDQQYDAIILSKAGLDRLNFTHLITEVLDKSFFLPAACQGAVGIQVKENSPMIEHLKKINHIVTERECLAERRILKKINANCNSPISVAANIDSKKITIACEVFDHNGNKLFKETSHGHEDQFINLSEILAEKILSSVGQKKINELDVLNNDFDYKAI